VLEDAGAHLSEQALFAAKAAAAVMGMNNIFYRFRHFSSNPRYAKVRPVAHADHAHARVTHRL